MSYLIRCDVCGKEISKDKESTYYRVEVILGDTDHYYTRHICKECYPRVEDIINSWRRRGSDD